MALTGYKFFFDRNKKKLIPSWAWGISHSLWLSISLGYFLPNEVLLSGIVGYEINIFFASYIGSIGIFALLAFTFLCFIVIELGWTPEKMKNWLSQLSNKNSQNINEGEEILTGSVPLDLNSENKNANDVSHDTTESKNEIPIKESVINKDDLIMEVETLEEESVEDELANSLIKKQDL